jgi:hypothetical protein
MADTKVTSESNTAAGQFQSQMEARIKSLEDDNKQLTEKLHLISAFPQAPSARSTRFFGDDDRSEVQSTRWSMITLGQHMNGGLSDRESSGKPRSRRDIVGRSWASFEVALAKTLVYGRVKSDECDVSFRSSAAGSNAWSMLSGLSLNAVSAVSVVGIPITLKDIKMMGFRLTMEAYAKNAAGGYREVEDLPQTIRYVCLFMLTLVF